MQRVVSLLGCLAVVTTLVYARPVILDDDYRQFSLHWNPPSAFTNGDHLSLKRDLQAYVVYYGPSRERVRQHSIRVNPRYNRVSLRRLNAAVVKAMPLVYLGITAVAKDDVESELSEVIFFLP
jgi:hypothetical protein